ncbi:MAG: hypothetical protein ACRD3D_01995 [Terriglobia bacterium]
MTRTELTRTAWVALAAGCLIASAAQPLLARKHKPKEATGNDPTSRLYQTLDQNQNGKLSLYLLADVYADPAHPGQDFQRVLYVVYNKDLYFGRFTIHVRSVSKLTPQQLSTYTPEEIFSYADSDSAVFEKIDPGPFGKTGDEYLVAANGRPVASAAITPDVQQEYDLLVTDYILPAVAKQGSAKAQ